MRTRKYPSDLTDRQWRLVRHLIPVCPGGRPRRTSPRDVLDAVFYLLKTGCQWRFLPADFPPRSTVWRYFNEWRHNGTLGVLIRADAGSDLPPLHEDQLVVPGDGGRLLVVDCMDRHSPILRLRTHDRKEAYRGMGWAVAGEPEAPPLGRGTWGMLLAVEKAVWRTGYTVLVVDDIKSAFENTPLDAVLAAHGRLLARIEQHAPPVTRRTQVTRRDEKKKLLWLVDAVLRGDDPARGLPQGNNYSPCALNAVLHD